MFENIGAQLQKQFRELSGRGVLSEKDVNHALADMEQTLLEGDVALPVIHQLWASVRADMVGKKLLATIRPGDAVVKAIHDNLVSLLSYDDKGKPHSSPQILLQQKSKPSVMMMVGLQGSGKTTSTMKLAHWLIKNHQPDKKLPQDKKQWKKILVASLDIYRPAAMEQLAILAKQNQIDCLPIKKNEKVLAIADRAMASAKKGGYDYLLLDTAGRLTLDQALMEELVAVKKLTNPKNILLVLDGLSGQSALDTAKGFHRPLKLSGAMMTRMEGDGRGGAALSLTAMTGCPLWFLGLGEQVDKIDVFSAERIAGQILGQGDIVALVEQAQATSEADEMAAMEARIKKGIFTLDDMRQQLRQMKKMGGMKEILAKLPQGLLPHNMKNLNSMGLDDKVFAKQEAIINSMTKKERNKPDIILASRKNRIAKGAGVQVAEVNRLLKQFMNTQKMMKQAGRMDEASLRRQMEAMKGQNPARFLPN